MTEDEALTKWCPFARDSNTGGNRLRYGAAGEVTDPQYGAEAAGEFPCIASACAVWLWTDPGKPARTEEAETGTDVPRVKIKPPEGVGWYGHAAGRDRPDRPGASPYRWVTWQREIPAVPGNGRCGLAGSVQ